MRRCVTQEEHTFVIAAVDQKAAARVLQQCKAAARVLQPIAAA
jgi:hypothetical protein